MARDHLLIVDTFVPRPREETFAFFAAPENLERITPPELRFEITTAAPIEMAEGTRIEYRLGLLGIRFSWTTLITHLVSGERFVDEQLRGPYAKWVHTHTFFDAPGGTQVRDEVRYRLPFYPLGEVVHPLVRHQLNRIFEFRGARIRELLGPRAA